MTKMWKTLPVVVLASVAVLMGGCANGIPTEGNMGYMYAPTISACRAGNGTPNDACVNADLNRCKSLVDAANPGRDESTYMGLVNGLTTIIGAIAGYGIADVTTKAFQQGTTIYSGVAVGSNVGTALTYNKVLYRSSVEACMYALGRDPKLTEQYMGLVAYTGRTQNFDEMAAKVAASRR